MFGTPYQGVTPDQHHTQSFENQVTSDAVIAFNPPVRAWYPSAPGRVRALFIFYVFSFIITLGYFVVYTVVEHPMGPLLYGQTEPAEFGWHFIYFSYWVGMLHILFFLMAIIDLWQRQSEWSEQFHAYKDKFYDILFALTTLIFVTYWFTVFPNRLSDHNDILRHFGEDLFQYGFPTFFIAVETLVISHRYAMHTCHIFRDMIIPVVIYGGYVGWSYLCHHKNELWAYKYQQETTSTLIAVSYASGGVAVALFFFIGKMLTKCMWPDQPISAEHDDDYDVAFGALPDGEQSFINPNSRIYSNL